MLARVNRERTGRGPLLPHPFNFAACGARVTRSLMMCPHLSSECPLPDPFAQDKRGSSPPLPEYMSPYGRALSEYGESGT